MIWERPMTLCVPEQDIEDLPAEWVVPSDGGAIYLHRVWLGYMPLDREAVGWAVGLQELHRQETLAGQAYADAEMMGAL